VQENVWVVLTSLNAVDRFMGALRDARALGSVLVAAVGPSTADALRQTGVEPDLVPAEHSAWGLVEEFPDAPVGGTWRVLFPAGDLAPATIPDGLGRKGWEVHRVEAYRTVARAAPEPGLLERVAVADALTLAAPSGVQAFLALRTPEGQAVRVPDHIVCIGPTTADAARAAGLHNVHEAWGASARGIVNELIGELGPRGDDGS
jgi:uroporphyrinogen III methyltransferase/synthase